MPPNQNQPAEPGQPIPSPAPKSAASAKPQKAKLNSWAMAGLILAILIPPVGLVISIIGLIRVKKTKQRGRGIAIAGIVLGVLLTVLLPSLRPTSLLGGDNSCRVVSYQSEQLLAHFNDYKILDREYGECGNWFEQYSNKMSYVLQSNNNTGSTMDLFSNIKQAFIQNHWSVVSEECMEGICYSFEAEFDTPQTTANVSLVGNSPDTFSVKFSGPYGEKADLPFFYRPPRALKMSKQEIFETSPFAMYEPSWLPPGWSTTERDVDPDYILRIKVKVQAGINPQLVSQSLYGYQNPKVRCTATSWSSCKVIGTTKDGNDIFVEEKAVFTVVGNTIVSLWDGYYDDRFDNNAEPRMSDQDIVKLFDSLQPIQN